MNVFQLFTGSFHSAAAYRYMRAKANFGMGYALFVVAVVTFLVTMFFGLQVYSAAFMAHGDQPPLFDSVIRDMGKQAPVMTLKGDTLATKDPEISIIRARGSYNGENFDQPVITIDTSGKTLTENATTPILVTDKQLFIQNGKNWKSRPLSDFTKGGANIILVNHAVADEMAQGFVDYIHGNLVQYYILVWLFCIVCLFVVSFFILLALGVAGMTIGNAIKSPLSFGAAVALASLSFTPVALLDAALLTFFGYAAHLVTLLLAGIVTLYAAIKCSEPPTTPVTV